METGQRAEMQITLCSALSQVIRLLVSNRKTVASFCGARNNLKRVSDMHGVAALNGVAEQKALALGIRQVFRLVERHSFNTHLFASLAIEMA